MEVTRRQSVLAIAAVLGGALVRALLRRRIAWRPGSTAEGQDAMERAAAGVPSRRVVPAPHSVKRHG
jgi:hypothetical protein